MKKSICPRIIIYEVSSFAEISIEMTPNIFIHQASIIQLLLYIVHTWIRLYVNLCNKRAMPNS